MEEKEIKKNGEDIQTEEPKKPNWFKRNKGKILGAIGAAAGIAGAVVLGKKVKDYSDQWNEGQAELQQRFPDGKFLLTDEEGNSFECQRQAFFGGGKSPSELLFWAEAPEDSTDTED